MQWKQVSIFLSFLLVIGLFSACQKQVDLSQPPASSVSDTEMNEASVNSQTESLFVKFDSVDLNGESVSSEEFSDYKLTVINIWGTWCPPCVSELPELQEVSQAFANQETRLIGMLQDGVNADGTEKNNQVIENAKVLMETAKADYTVVLPDATFMTEIMSKVQAFPTTLFVDSEGEVIHAVSGARNFDQWSELIHAVLQVLEE